MSRLLFGLFIFISAASALFFSDGGHFLKNGFIKSLNPAPPAPPVPLPGPVPAPAPAPGPGPGPGPIPKGCPLCDSGVYGYCSFKLVHDACCCHAGNVPFHCPLPADCSYLNANSCYEHALLFTCCCNNPYH